MINELEAITVVTRCQVSFGNRHAHRVRKTLTKRAGSGLNTGGDANFWVTRSDAADLDGWTALTGLLMKEGDFELALNFLREAYVHHPTEARIKIKMAVCHLKHEDNALAIKFLNEGLIMDSSLLSEFEYFFPKGSTNKKIDRIIQQYKK